MKNKLYIECSTGISGDMTVASLLDLGADREKLSQVLESLKKTVGGFDIKISDVTKSAIRACDFDVILDQDNHDHDMQYLYGHEQGHEHHHEHDHEHRHEHDHNHHHGHHHVHRSLGDVVAIINSADMSDNARKLAIKIFTIVAEAEAAVHGRTIEEVHFHEVGAIDSIVDIISAAVCMDDIMDKYDIEDVIITKLVDGTGTIRCQHGVLPVPVPAVLKIAEQTGVPISIAPRKGEYVTPTGAAFAAAVLTDRKLPESFTVLKTGLGAGKRNHEIPGILRTMVISAN